MSDDLNISDLFVSEFKDNPNGFEFLSADRVLHTRSLMFFDSSFGVVGCIQKSYIDNKEIVSHKLLNVDSKSVKKIQKAYAEWKEWLTLEGERKVLDIISDYNISN